MENGNGKKQPCAEVAYGFVRAAAWKNEGRPGEPYTFSLSKSYRTEDNKQRFGRSFELKDIAAIFMCIHAIHTKIDLLESEPG